MKKTLIEIKEVPVEYMDNNKKDISKFKTAASGYTSEEALINLLSAINQDTVDTDNCYLKIYTSEI